MTMAAAAVAAAVAATLACFPLSAADEPSGPGWTGASKPLEVIAARQGLMTEMERLMQPLDSYTVGEPAAPEELDSRAQTIARMLATLPHLFPPTTNLYDPKAETPATIALPAIWQQFPAFEAFAHAAAQSATNMAALKDPDALRTAALQLRGTCDACHTPFLRAYVAEEASEQDADFDFDSVFKSKPDP